MTSRVSSLVVLRPPLSSRFRIIIDVSLCDADGLPCEISKTKLMYLQMSFNANLGSLSNCLARLTNMRYILADSCGLHALPDLGNMTLLHTLTVTGNFLTSVSFVSKLQNL